MVSEVLRNIRELCNHPWKRELLFQDRVKWDKLWASMDAIGDTQVAIEHYLNLPEFDGSAGYLHIYGILQALNIQQDALVNLSQALFNKTIDFKSAYPDLYTIREHRNNAIGHPTNRGNDRSFHLIGRMSISKRGFTLASYYPKTGQSSKFEDVDIINCINIQKELITKILEDAMKILESEFNDHKNKFKGCRLSDMIPDSLSYHFSKLYEHGPDALVEVNFEYIRDLYEKLKQGITERYFSLDALTGVKYTCETLDYIFDRLQRDLVDSRIGDDIELRIFVDALQNHFDELLEMIDEIDAEFATDGNTQ